jgi:hypothetical protein
MNNSDEKWQATHAPDYREQMFKKSKCNFLEFYGLFRYFVIKSAEEKKNTHLSNKNDSIFMV